jgi:hypothetical protein
MEINVDSPTIDINRYETKYISLFLIFNVLGFEWALFREARMYEFYYLISVILAYQFDDLQKKASKISLKNIYLKNSTFEDFLRPPALPHAFWILPKSAPLYF